MKSINVVIDKTPKENNEFEDEYDVSANKIDVPVNVPPNNTEI